MGHTIVFDCEFLVCEGAPGRHWCGPHDPDPLVVQIGAAKLDFAAPFEIVDTLGTVIRPVDRHGAPCPIDPAFAALTGLDEATIAATRVPLTEASRWCCSIFCGRAVWRRPISDPARRRSDAPHSMAMSGAEDFAFGPRIRRSSGTTAITIHIMAVKSSR